MEGKKFKNTFQHRKMTLKKNKAKVKTPKKTKVKKATMKKGN
jgi:hypothetical protein